MGIKCEVRWINEEREMEIAFFEGEREFTVRTSEWWCISEFVSGVEVNSVVKEKELIAVLSKGEL